MARDGTIDPELTKGNIIHVEGWVWDTDGLPQPDTKEAKGRSGWKSGLVIVKISDLEKLGFERTNQAPETGPKKSATTAALECCGQPMVAYSTSISHTAYSCHTCGKAVQVKGGWGNEDLLRDGFESPHAMLPIIEPECTCKVAQREYESAFQMVQEVGSMKALENANKCFEAVMEAMNNCPAHGKQKGIPCPKCGHALTRMWMTDGTRVIGHYCPTCKEAVHVSPDGAAGDTQNHTESHRQTGGNENATDQD